MARVYGERRRSPEFLGEAEKLPRLTPGNGTGSEREALGQFFTLSVKN